MQQLSEALIDAAIATYIEGCDRITATHHEANGYSLKPNTHRFQRGKRYVKVITVEQPRGQDGSVHSFIDTNGDVLKPASWSRPAKHARGNIFDEHNGLKDMGPYGPAYLR